MGFEGASPLQSTLNKQLQSKGLLLCAEHYDIAG